jgi:hypothetical protein
MGHCKPISIKEAEIRQPAYLHLKEVGGGGHEKGGMGGGGGEGRPNRSSRGAEWRLRLKHIIHRNKYEKYVHNFYE